MGDQPLSNIAQAWLEKHAEMESAEEARDEYGDVLARRAHTILKDRHRYQRAYQYPHTREIEIKDDKIEVWFAISNGIDYGDDFSVKFTIEELEAVGGDRLFSPSELES